MSLNLKPKFDELQAKAVANNEYFSSWDGAPYYKPELYGLETVDEIDLDSEAYQFNVVVVYRKLDDGTLYYDQDSGCSCPTPFEDAFNPERLFSTEELEKLWRDKVSYSKTPQADWDAFIENVKRAFQQLSERV